MYGSLTALFGRVGENFQTLWAFVLVLGIIIFVHEFGHFVVAKAFGMRVFIFSFGFGRRLAGFKLGDTDYRLSLVPLGGYVKLEGEPEDFLSENTSKLGDGKDFLARPRWQRFLTYLAGPAMNVALTVAILTAAYMIGVYESSERYARAIVGAVEPGSPAEKAGLSAGDEVVTVDRQPVSRWDELRYRVALSRNRPLQLGLRRPGLASVAELQVVPVAKGKANIGDIGAYPPVYIVGTSPGWPAEQAGLRVDDAIVRIGREPVYSSEELVRLIKASSGNPLALKVYRQGQFLDIAVTPRKDGPVYRIGVTTGAQRVFKRLGPLAALGEALNQTWDLTNQIVGLVKGLVTLRVSPRVLGGPIEIAKESGASARRGSLGLFIAFISLNVGILNVFPLLPLDGGHMLILALETLVRRDFSLKIKEWAVNVGAVVLFALLVLVFYSDLSKTALLGKYLP